MRNYRKYVQYLQGLTMSHIKCSTINHVILIHDTTLAVYTRDIKTAEHIVAMTIIAKMIENKCLAI